MLQAEGAPKRRRLAETRGWGGTWKGRATTRPHVRSPSFDLSEKLRKQAEKDKGKQGPRRTLCPLPQVAESGGGRGNLLGRGGKRFRPRGSWEQDRNAAWWRFALPLPLPRSPLLQRLQPVLVPQNAPGPSVHFREVSPQCSSIEIFLFSSFLLQRDSQQNWVSSGYHAPSAGCGLVG